MKVQYWFKANKSGYGWYPANWKGWFMIAFYIAGLIYSFILIDSKANSWSDTLINFIPRFLVLTALLTILTYLKGESIVWGEKEKDQHKIP